MVTIALYGGRCWPWMKVGAICEVWGEGRGRLFRVTVVERDLGALQLEEVDTGRCQGREAMHKCHRSYLARKAERPRKARRSGVDTKKLRLVLSAPSMVGLACRAEFLMALDELDRLRARLVGVKE